MIPRDPVDLTREQRDGWLARVRETLGADPGAALRQRETDLTRRAIVYIGQVLDDALPHIDVDAVTRAIEALRAFERPARADLEELGRAIHYMRGVALVQDGRLQDTPALRDWSAAARRAIERAVGGVAALWRADGKDTIGTGFVVGPRLLATCDHVVEALASPGGARAVFGYEHQRPATAIKIEGVVQRFARPLDIAILRLSRDPPGAPLRWSAEAVAPGSPLMVTGHPTLPGDPNGAGPVTRIVFDGVSDVLRAAPGQLVGDRDGALQHDAATLGGNSGSPILDPAGRVMGVHRSRTFRAVNLGTSAGQIRRTRTLAAMLDWS